MAVLHLPLTLNQAGVFERASTEEDFIGARLRLFINSGAGEYLRLPSPGIRALWIQLYTMGVSTRFLNVMEEDKRRSIERIILEEVNNWLEDVGVIEGVILIGDEREENGIKFRTSNKEFVFTFRYVRPGHGLHAGSIGPWNILETVHEIH